MVSPEGEKDNGIEYPCDWDFTIIGVDADEMREAIVEVVGYDVENIREGNRSSGGRYISLRFSVLVWTEESRNRLYQDLADHVSIRVVI